MARSEIETAYFALLRAREELDAVRRYGEFLREEARRCRRFVAEGDALADTIDRRLRRSLRHTDTLLSESVKSRLTVIEEELRALEAREAAASAFVTECEQAHASLQSGN